MKGHSVLTQNKTGYDLEERSFEFAKSVREFVVKLPKTLINIDDIKQLIRSLGSIGANYIEANESLSKKDFVMRAKISRKESKESILWLRLIEVNNAMLEKEKKELIEEATALMKILGAIIQKCK